MPAWLIPAIQGAAQISSQVLQNYYNRRAADRANAYDRESNDIAFGREMELLKYQNDFNSPLNQMKRFKDAGLNPNLVYGQGTLWCYIHNSASVVRSLPYFGTPRL